ncbi:hypothetical protein [Deinococcus sp. UYEF24]
MKKYVQAGVQGWSVVSGEASSCGQAPAGEEWRGHPRPFTTTAVLTKRPSVVIGAVLVKKTGAALAKKRNPETVAWTYLVDDHMHAY